MSAIGEQEVVGLGRENEKEKVEVLLRQRREGSMAVEIRSMRWGQGIGWYAQKTLTLAPGQASQLAHLLRRFSSAAQVRKGRPKVVPFRKRTI
jgi:hypothetical protein